MKPLISVIIPVYNVEEYLRQCLDSVINQTYENLQIIAVNDCSTDSSLQILEEYAQKDKRMVVISNKENLGVGLTRNEGMKIAKGDFIHFLDPDDWLEPNIYIYIEREREKDFPDILCFKRNEYNNETKESKTLDFKNAAILNKTLNPIKDIEAFDNWDRYVWQKLHKRSFLLENNIVFNNSKSISDMEYAALCYINCKSLVYTDIVGINYRICRKGSLVSQSAMSFKNIVSMYESNKKLYKDLPDELRYKLLGFDYMQIFFNADRAYAQGVISFLELMSLYGLNTPETKKYVYDGSLYHQENLIFTPVNPLKIMMKKIFRLFSGFTSD